MKLQLASIRVGRSAQGTTASYGWRGTGITQRPVAIQSELLEMSDEEEGPCLYAPSPGV